MADVVGSKAVEAAVGNVTDRAVDSVFRQVGYVWNYKSNIRDLENQLRMLKAERDSVRHRMEEATRKGKIVEEPVNVWCESADAAIQAADDLLKDHGTATKSCFMGFCPNLNTRHKFSRKAIKESIPALAKVQQDRTSITRISYPKDVQQLKHPTNYETLGSRMAIVEEILEALKSTGVNQIGVYGFAGVGKSTLVKDQIVDHVREKNVCKVVVTANVTHSWDLSKIQQEIADWLGLKFSSGTTEVRAAELYARLEPEEKKVLIILDDIWETIALEKIGIPEGCKILMTSRDLNVLLKMDVQRHFHLQVLEQEEAWQLFETKAGDLRNLTIRQAASEVAKRCLGLPVLIVPVASSLRGKELCEWNDALERLKQLDHREMDDKVYSALELSYNYLDADAQSLLDLYAQLPSSMLISDLVKFAMGLDLFQNCKTLKAVRNRLLRVVNDLKNSCLLLEDVNELHVRIHDVVHSFVAKLASKDNTVFALPSKSVLEEWPEEHKLKQLTAISLPYCKIPQLPEVLGCPELKSFLLWNSNPSLKIPENFFSGTKKLKLVGLFGVQVLPSSLDFLKNLQALCLHGCVLGDTRTIGELQKLRVLSLSSSSVVQHPMEIRNLSCLQLLDLSRCRGLEVIPRDILNCLTKLEELCMLGTIVHWESEELKNAGLSDLQSLPNLINLEIHIMDAKMIPTDLFHNDTKLERFRIFIGPYRYNSGEYKSSKLLKLERISDAELQRVKVLLAKTENLHLDGVKGVKNVVPQLERRGFPDLMELFVRSCDEMELIMGGANTFSSSSFSNLKKLSVSYCNALRYLFSFSVFRCLTHLQELDVRNCRNLEMIVGYEDGDDNSDNAILKLAHLVKLDLENLPRLGCFGSPIANEAYGEISRAGEYDSLFTTKIELPNLERLSIWGLSALKAIWNDVADSQLRELKLWNLPSLNHIWRADPNNGFVKFGKLSDVHICLCPSLKTVFPSSVAKGLVHLEKLEIWNSGIEQIVGGDGEEVDGAAVFEFPMLTSLILRDLSQLESLCPATNPLQCPALQELTITPCNGLLKSILSQEKIWPNLETLLVVRGTSKELFPTEDLQTPWNELLQAIKSLLVIECDNFINLASFSASFKYLTSLAIIECGGLLSLVTASTAKSFVQLKTLRVFRCNRLKVVVSDEGDETTGEITFPRLETLQLYSLPSLTMFSSAYHKLKFPCLIDVDVYLCPNMELFSKGVPTTPLLQRVEWDSKTSEVACYGDLNSTVSSLHEETLARSRRSSTDYDE